MRREKWTLKTLGGDVLSVLIVEAEPFEPSPLPAAPAAPRPQPAPVPAQDNGEARMTEPQKRYLFRLLGAQGVEGKKAEDQLKTQFKVSRLADIPKQAASEYIDQLVKDQQDAKS